MNSKKIIFFLFIVLSPLSVFAEVADKVPSFSFICYSSIAIGLLGFLISSYRIKFGIIALLIAFVFSFMYSELLSIAASIIQELGEKYIIAVYLSFPVMFIPIIIGMGIRISKKIRSKIGIKDLRVEKK